MTATAPAWLWTKTAETLADYWRCQVCPASGEGARDLGVRAAAHVTATGHAVTITHAHTTTLEGVRTHGGTDRL